MCRKLCLLFIFFSIAASAISRDKGPVAKFSFNDGKDYDEISHAKIRTAGVSYSRDRFGNKGNAIYLYGNSSSYLNLGNYKALKPEAGSISMWINIITDCWSGKGRLSNPFIITKNSAGNDFYEAYNIGYFPDIKRIYAICSQDSVDQLVINSIETFEWNEWHHVVVTYDNSGFSMYIDGKIEKTLPKNFKTKFLESDSVVMGVTANKKNNRFFEGNIDDVAFYDRVISPDEVYDLYTAPNPNKNRIILNWVLVILAFVIFVVLVFIFIRYRIKTTLEKEKQQMALTNKGLENELRVHRALMNPHFIFNSLNGLQNFILTNSTEEANDYLVKFSKLIRKILESNMADTITVELEAELLERYLEIEEMRFEENISHSIIISPGIIASATVIPIMMIQPFVENAIWHGLLNKEGDKAIFISFDLYDKRYVKCIIEDNGIGRKKENNDDTEKKSLATIFIRQRLELLNKIHNLQCSLNIEDKPGNEGTIVTLILPVLN